MSEVCRLVGMWMSGTEFEQGREEVSEGRGGLEMDAIYYSRTVQLGVPRSLFLFCSSIRTIGSVRFHNLSRDLPQANSIRRGARLYDGPLTITDVQASRIRAALLIVCHLNATSARHFL